MASAHKKVIVRMLDGGLAWGYLPQSGFLRENSIELMTVDGKVSSLLFNEVKSICYVRDFNLDDRRDPERIGRRRYLTRPKGDGLWVRLGFKDGEEIEGIASFDPALGLGFVDSLLEHHGVFLIPPDGRGNTFRMFVTRAAIRSMEILAVISATSKRAAKTLESPGAAAQARLFGEQAFSDE